MAIIPLPLPYQINIRELRNRINGKQNSRLGFLKPYVVIKDILL